VLQNFLNNDRARSGFQKKTDSHRECPLKDWQVRVAVHLKMHRVLPQQNHWVIKTCFNGNLNLFVNKQKERKIERASTRSIGDRWF